MLERVAATWDDDVLPALVDYIRIPAVSVAFDPDWERHGHIDAAVEHVRAWCAARPIEGIQVEVVRLPGRTPVIVVEVPGTDGAAGPDQDTVLLYGHLDKQPEMTGWREGLGPWTPVRDGDALYGRGGADDGYAAFAALTALEAVRADGGAHARCVLLVEASEESGSPDLPAYVEALAPRIGPVSLVVCLDSGCATYDRLWVTTSLRGLASVVLRVDVLTEGVHSGSASGIVPSSFRVLRRLLDRIEDPDTGRILVPDLLGDPSPARLAQVRATAEELGDGITASWPFAGGTQAMTTDPTEALLNRTWRPTLSVVGMDGIPSIVDGGNVLRPTTAASLSFRLPPGVDAHRAGDAVVEALEADPLHGAQVRAELVEAADGWEAPDLRPWLAEALDAASQESFGADARFIGEGGSIPFMGMLGERFPDAQFVVTGVLGPGSNAHGPNEMLHVPTAQRVTASVARLLAAHVRR
ncbi:M20/M25/M40 family metallo-hydrolase [Actinomarinicola tropica]|uniref:M20/M25/M40 family metallo-hydrolase n=1 Tax=Actinomarinicola tropica TaxID=2789776 RepID=A0A5Q2RM81_9ACTN|nr:M20/M25/M40 family metallo-hydrolase [Actinomarinicola tropica]QGG96052.1 M20/M25/M40 family metallo-hydrolase [Actinomarinicola tropica]